MSSERNSPLSHPALDKRAQAAAWLARLHGPQRSPEVERGFYRWLQADPEHRSAYELLTERLEVAERLCGRPLPRGWRRQDRAGRSRWTTMGIVAASAVAMFGGFFWLHDPGFATQVGEQRTIALPDGSHMYLNTDTRAVVRFTDRSRIVELKKGEALFDVARNAGRPFVVVAGERRVQVLGTTFLVRQDSASTAVTLIEGKVIVSSPDVRVPELTKASGAASTQPPALGRTPADARLLAPGERVTFAADKPARLDEPPLDKITAWRQGQVALEDMSLSDAVAEMNRYSTVKMSVASPQVSGLRVGGFFRMGDSVSFARAVASWYGLQVIERPHEILLAGEPKL